MIAWRKITAEQPFSDSFMSSQVLFYFFLRAGKADSSKARAILTAFYRIFIKNYLAMRYSMHYVIGVG